VGVQFKIDADGILEVLARDTATGKDVVVNIESSAVNVDDAAVEEMVGKSVEFAFEDMAERIFTEAKMKADELLPAVEMILDQGFVEEAERAGIEESVTKVKSAMAAADANGLKAAVKRLDEATEAAAARLVERAMEEALEREMGL
jgi:molecular chaperone DnaK